jgi:3-methyl-2-oxobutanoate hydroxymethyltransferase
MEEAGAVMIVLEGVPDEVAAQITETVNVPTIGIGAGSQCDGQILVLHDILNLSFTTPAKFVRRYADIGAQMHQAIGEYSIDVREGRFPSKEESYHLAPEVRAVFFDAIGKRSSEQIETDAVGGPLSENLAELRR